MDTLHSDSSLPRVVVSVLTPDRVGLLRDITGAVFTLGGNIGHIRQTVVDGFFNLVFTAEYPVAVSGEGVRAAIAGKLDSASSVVSVMDCPSSPRPPVVPVGSRFVAMTAGEDCPGTIFAISSFLVAHGVNIEDWGVSEDDGRVVYIAQVVVPESVDFRLLQTSFREKMAKSGLTAMLCHENIFRATNEIGPIKALLDQDK